jgi:hypothetical protein
MKGRDGDKTFKKGQSRKNSEINTYAEKKIPVKILSTEGEGDYGKESAGLRTKKNKFSASFCGSDVDRFSSS